MQELKPDVDACEPAAQVVYAEAPAELYDPDEQGLHKLDPKAFVYVPATQEVQIEAPVDENDPTRHCVHAPDDASEYHPALQMEQLNPLEL